MQESTKEKLEAAAASMNWGTPHPFDMERYWDFVIEAFKNEDRQIGWEIFLKILKKYCKDEEIIAKFHSRYTDGIELLERYAS